MLRVAAGRTLFGAVDLRLVKGHGCSLCRRKTGASKVWLVAAVGHPSVSPPVLQGDAVCGVEVEFVLTQQDVEMSRHVIPHEPDICGFEEIENVLKRDQRAFETFEKLMRALVDEESRRS